MKEREKQGIRVLGYYAVCRKNEYLLSRKMIPQLSRARSANTIRLSDCFMSLRARKYTVMYVICTNPVGNRNTANEGRITVPKWSYGT